MNKASFESKIRTSVKPVVVEFWAPWCVPCKIMSPLLDKVSADYQDKVEIIRLNADQNPELARALRIMGIPTLLGFRNGREVIRRAGAQNEVALRAIFEALYLEKPLIQGPAPLNRLLRLAVGLALGVFGWLNEVNYILLGAAALIFFSAVYDRCPVYRVIAPRLAGFFQRLISS